MKYWKSPTKIKYSNQIEKEGKLSNDEDRVSIRLIVKSFNNDFTLFNIFCKILSTYYINNFFSS